MKNIQFFDLRGAAEDYESFLRRQEYVWEQRLLDLAPNTVILSRNTPTITLGARSIREQLPHIRTVPKHWLDEPDDEILFAKARKFMKKEFAIELIRTSRGGSVWYHDMGVLQISIVAELEHGFPSEIVYPLEETLYQTLEALSVPVERVAERKRPELQSHIGVWSSGRKLAAIGVRIRRFGKKQISMFGAALNVSPSPANLCLIDPCGISGKESTSLKEVLGKRLQYIEPRLVTVFQRKFQEVFEVEIPAPDITAQETIF